MKTCFNQVEIKHQIKHRRRCEQVWSTVLFLFFLWQTGSHTVTQQNGAAAHVNSRDGLTSSNTAPSRPLFVSRWYGPWRVLHAIPECNVLARGLSAACWIERRQRVTSDVKVKRRAKKPRKRHVTSSSRSQKKKRDGLFSVRITRQIGKHAQLHILMTDLCMRTLACNC